MFKRSRTVSIIINKCKMRTFKIRKRKGASTKNEMKQKGWYFKYLKVIFDFELFFTLSPFMGWPSKLMKHDLNEYELRVLIKYANTTLPLFNSYIMSVTNNLPTYVLISAEELRKLDFWESSQNWWMKTSENCGTIWKNWGTILYMFSEFRFNKIRGTVCKKRDLIFW